MKAAVLLATASTFGIWLFAEYYFMNRVNDIESRTAQINVRYMKAQNCSRPSAPRSCWRRCSSGMRFSIRLQNPADYHGQVDAVLRQ
jgi:hypothetical protein